MKNNLLVVHGGGPTAVINASLYGVITEALKSDKIDKIYGAIGGSEAILKENFLDLGTTDPDKLKLLLTTPGSAIGSSRYALEQKDYDSMVEVFKRNNIKYVLFNGGNGTMDTCGKVSKVCQKEDIFVAGIPKSIDNDISIIDHAPGYGSAAKFIAVTTAEIGQDVKALPIHVCVVEAMGRNAGWITAASALARKDKKDAPHLIYLPERPFDEEEFLKDLEDLYQAAYAETDDMKYIVHKIIPTYRLREADILRDQQIQACWRKEFTDTRSKLPSAFLNGGTVHKEEI